MSPARIAYPPASRASRRRAGQPPELEQELEQELNPTQNPPSSLYDDDSFLSVAPEEEGNQLSPATISQADMASSSGQGGHPNNSPSQAPEMAALLQSMQALLERMDRLEQGPATRQDTESVRQASQPPANSIERDENRHLPARQPTHPRDVTPANSAWHPGATYIPLGIAARPEFRPYGINAGANNPEYDRKSRESGGSLAIFSGDRGEFRDWLNKLTDKVRENNETFKTERSRMAFLYNHLSGTASGILRSRYESVERPFSSLAEMIQMLASVYHSDNIGTEARAKLNTMMFKDENQSIEEFIAEMNTLMDDASVSLAERKLVLYEHIHPGLGNELHGQAKDDRLSYDAFMVNVSNAAAAFKRARQFGREQRRLREESKAKTAAPAVPRYRPPFQRQTITETRVADGGNRPRLLPEAEFNARRLAGTCFSCGKTGHQSHECVTRAKPIQAVQAESGEMPAADEGSGAEEDQDHVEEKESASESENE
jgi:hypothetical protein